jgi:penicillin amidase
MMKRIVRKISFAIAAVLILAILVGWLVLRGSLPGLDGEIRLAGLADGVTILRDETGVVTIKASNRADLAQATGFAHAQDRFFQMDLTRRKSAGELSELFGSIAIEVDKASRIHRFRRRAQDALERLDPVDQSILDAYTRGVNQGLASLSLKPFEYFLLGVSPEPWQREDSLLIIFSMYLLLNDSLGERDSALALLNDTLPPEMVRFLVPQGTMWDAPLEGDARSVEPIPAAEVFDLGRGGPVEVAAMAVTATDMTVLVGSNNWAVGGDATADGRAIVANDMHLPLAVPNTFYRMRLEQSGDAQFEITGVSLPGQPAIIAGSNGSVAWGFTNSYGDWTDVIQLTLDPDDPTRYLTPDGFRAFELDKQVIEVKGADAVETVVRHTIWGPVIDPDHRGRLQAVKWLAHEPEAINIVQMEMERVQDIYQAMDVSNRSGSPPQNAVIADSQGNFGWTIMGRIPIRAGIDASVPSSWQEEGSGWVGWLRPQDYPRIVNPSSGRIWTANARVADGANLLAIGDNGYALGARAKQIRDDLFALSDAGIDDMLAIQLDDRAIFYERWRDLALEALEDNDSTAQPLRSDFRGLVENWLPRAATDSVGFRLVYEFRLRLLGEIFEALTVPVREVDPDFHFAEGHRYGVSRQFEGVAWRLLENQPGHLLNPLYDSWKSQILAAIDYTIDKTQSTGGLARHTWGDRNISNIRHPMSGAIPLIGKKLNMVAQPLAGATHMPHVQTPTFGSSERFAVSPGREAEAYFHMPTGQSGHPLSPYYRAGHESWVRGDPTPFLPGPQRHQLRLLPPES